MMLILYLVFFNVSKDFRESFDEKSKRTKDESQPEK